MRFAFIQAEKAQFGVATLCRALLVSSAGYYAWCLRPKSAHAVQDEKLKVLVNEAHTVEGRTSQPPLMAAHSSMSTHEVAPVPL
jgi:putative transposase